MADDQGQGQDQVQEAQAAQEEWGPPPEAPEDFYDEAEPPLLGAEESEAAAIAASAAPTAPTAPAATSAPASDPTPGTASSDSASAGSPGAEAAPPAPLEFLVGPRLLPSGDLHLLGGAPMAGKSTLLAQFLRQFVSPDPLFLPELQFARLDLQEIAVIHTDRPWSSNAHWYAACGLSEIPHYALADDPEAVRFMSKASTSTVPGVELFKFCLARLPQHLKLVVADVLTNAFVGNIFHAGIVHRHAIALQNLIRERGITLLGTAYGTKMKQGKQERYQRAIDRIIGAAPFRGALSSILYLEASEESDHDYQRLSWYSRHHTEAAFALSRSPETGLYFERRDVVLSSQKLREEPVTLPGPRKRTGRPADPANADLILSLIAPGEALTRSALAARAVQQGMARTTAYSTFARLQEAGQLVWDETAGTILRPSTVPPKTAEPPAEPT